jgi:hypothetical protein
MQQNKAGEFQIPNSIHHPDYQKPVSDEVAEIYQEINGSVIETAFSQHHERLMTIGDEISRARQNKISNPSDKTAELKSGIMGAVSKLIFFPEYLEQQNQFNPTSIADLMQAESEIGSEIFGNNQNGNYVKFFNENRDHWFLYQESKSANGVIKSHTIHYEVQPNGILKTCDKTGPHFEYICDEELDNFLTATDIYYSSVMSRIYNKNITSASKKAS